jgi:type IV secretion system protein VirD4
MAPPRREPPWGGGELVVVVLGAVGLGVGVVVGAGARLAAAVSGGSVSGDVGDWLAVAGRLMSTPGDPHHAWGGHAQGLPGLAVYWTCTVFVAVAVGAVAVGGVWVWRRWSAPSRSLFGVPADARVARPRDVRPLVVAGSVPPTGRLLLGRLAPRGPLLATEDRERHPAQGRRAARAQGDLGSVALIGPTRSGKTVLASAGIIGWDGPVVALSVKRDLYDATASARGKRGGLAVFDPGGVTGLPTARWTPLRDVITTSGALRAGRALAQAIPRNGVTGGDFWASHGETLTSAYMCLAGLSQLLPAHGDGEREPLTIGRLASWAFMHVGITDPTANELIRLGLDDN